MATVKNEILIRIYIVLAIVVLAAIFIFAKAFKISWIEGEKWREQGQKSYVRHMPVEAERGSILSSNGRLLATSLPFFEIRFDLNADGLTEDIFMENVDTLAHCLATYVDTEMTVGGMREHLIERRTAGERFLLIKKNITYEELERISNFPIFNRGQYKGGFIVKRQPKRDRPFKMLAHRSIGYIREGSKPVGLEGYFDKVLAGHSGKRLMQKVRGDTWIPVNDLTEVEPQTGDDLMTTLDINLQDITHEALLRGLEHHNADNGTAILMDVETGAIRAISNIEKTKVKNKDGTMKDGWWETYNHAIGTAIEPGSTFKLAPMMALLEDERIDLYDRISIENGRTEFYEEQMEDSSKESFLIDSTTMKHAFEISSNVGIAKQIFDNYQGQEANGNVRANSFIKRLKQFNLHLPTGIEISGEPAPYIKDPNKDEDDWSGTTLPWMSIGYELTITPLQLLAFYNAVANDGRYMKPYLVDRIEHFGEVKRHYKPTVISQRIAKKSTIEKAKELLEAVVEHGTAHKLQTDRYKIAGKTGTAQIGYRKFNKKKKNVKYRASFVGYFPADEPKYSCIVVITNPRENGIYGGDVAGPIFREISDKTFASKIELHKAINSKPKPRIKTNYLPDRNIGFREDMQKILSYLDLPHQIRSSTEMSVIEAEADTLRLRNRTIRDESTVPNVVGMGLRDALYVLENKDLKVIFEGVGKVKKQSIKPGTKIKGQTIKLTLN